MSIYWVPDNDEPPRARSEASRGFGREIAALIYEQEIPWDTQALRSLVRRIWTSARGLHGFHRSGAGQPIADGTPGHRRY